MVVFHQRELPPAAHPISSDQLTMDNIYFMVDYADEEMKVPLVRSIVFIGRNLGDDDDTDTIYFQDVDSYLGGIRFSDNPTPGSCLFFHCSADDLGAIFEFEQALDELMKCSVRRKA